MGAPNQKRRVRGDGALRRTMNIFIHISRWLCQTNFSRRRFSGNICEFAYQSRRNHMSPTNIRAGLTTGCKIRYLRPKSFLFLVHSTFDTTRSLRRLVPNNLVLGVKPKLGRTFRDTDRRSFILPRRGQERPTFTLEGVGRIHPGGHK